MASANAFLCSNSPCISRTPLTSWRKFGKGGCRGLKFGDRLKVGKQATSLNFLLSLQVPDFVPTEKIRILPSASGSEEGRGISGSRSLTQGAKQNRRSGDTTASWSSLKN
uniref:Uncharacterized protein n=1 Tax=Cacopsylla melanoneura TaxID=428564 RepID=A0A8D9FHA5_9HEMI